MIQLKTTRTQWITGLAIGSMVTVVQLPATAALQQSPAGCRVTGRVTSLVAAPAGLFPGRGRAGQDPTAAEPAAQAAPACAEDRGASRVRRHHRRPTGRPARGRHLRGRERQIQHPVHPRPDVPRVGGDDVLRRRRQGPDARRAAVRHHARFRSATSAARRDAVVGRGARVDSGRRARGRAGPDAGHRSLHGAPRHLRCDGRGRGGSDAAGSISGAGASVAARLHAPERERGRDRRECARRRDERRPQHPQRPDGRDWPR